MAPRIRAQTIGGGLGITPTSVAFYDVLSAGGTIAQMAVGGGLTGTWALINSSSSLVALSAGGLMTRGAGAATSGTPVVQFTSGSTILQVPITATVIVATLPANTVLPAISPSGTPVVGVTLTATTGTWTGDPTPTYAYQWRQVDTSTNISGATSATYTPVSGDVGHTLTCVVTATNIKGSASASAATTPATISVPVAPVNTVTPGAPTGSANVGATLTAQNGTWTGNPGPTFTYAWLVNGVANGATGSTYIPVSGDLGSVISVRVTGTNVAGSASATSAATAAITIAPSIPSNTVAPGVPTGTPSVGNVLTAQNGTWAGYPAPTFTYQWQRNGTNISGATASTYTLVTADAGNPIRVVVTGTNASGSASANSTATTNVTMAPANTVAPTLSTNTPNVGSVITCSPGTWTGYAAPTYTYQWFWADTVAPISGATSSTYTPISGDVGHTLSCNVTGANSVGSASASTAATTSAVTSTPAMPSGALGIWYMDQTANGVVPNAVTANSASQSVIRARRMIGIAGTFAGAGGLTLTQGQTASDGSTDAVRIQATGSAGLINTSTGLPAGTYTCVITCKSNTGSSQNFNCILQSGSGAVALTATTSWQRLAVTKTLAAGDFIQPIQWISGTLDILVEDIELFIGSSDLGATVLSGHLYLGTTRYTRAPTYASGALDGSSDLNAIGYAQFAASTPLTTFTATVLSSKVATGGAGTLAALIKLASAFTDFGFFLENDASVSYANAMFGSGIVSPSPVGGTTAMGFWKRLSQGFHSITIRYNGTSLDLFFDDVRVGRKIYTATTPQEVKDLVFNNAGFNQSSGDKYSGMSLYNRALTDAEITATVSALQARAALSSITATNWTRYYYALGDSQTQGFQASTSDKGYAQLSAANASPAVIGNNFGVSSYALTDVVTLASTLNIKGMIPASLSGRKVIASILIGANDLATYTGASDTIAANNYLTALAALHNDLRSVGIKTIACTIMSRTDYTGATLTAFDARRAIVNSAITSSWTGVNCDGVSDFAGNANLGAVGASNSTTYWNADKVHPNDTGYNLMYTINVATLNAL